MGANSSKEAKKASNQPIKSTVSIGTPNPESVERWKRDSVQPKTSSQALTGSNGQGPQASASAGTPPPAASSSAAPSNAVAETGAKQITTSAPTESPAISSTKPKAESKSATTEGIEAPDKTGSPSDAALGKSGLRNNPVYEDDTPPEEITSEKHPESKPMTPEKEKPSAVPLARASAQQEIPRTTTPTSPWENKASGASKANTADADKARDSGASKTTAAEAGGPATAAPGGKTARLDLSEIQPIVGASKTNTSEIQPLEEKAGSGLATDSKPKSASPEITPAPLVAGSGVAAGAAGAGVAAAAAGKKPSSPAKSAALKSSKSNRAASGARVPEVPSISILQPVSAPSSRSPQTANYDTLSPQARDDKVRGGGCFGCFGPKQKFEADKHDPEKPPIGTPIGFVAPEEQAEVATPAISPEGVSSDKVSSKTAKQPVEVSQPEAEPLVNKRATESEQSPVRKDKEAVISPKTPEKLPVSTKAGNLTSSEPATPEQLPQVPNTSHEPLPSVPAIPHLASGVVVDFKHDNLEALESPMVSPPVLRAPEKGVEQTDKKMDVPKGETRTITGEQDVSTPRAVASLARVPFSADNASDIPTTATAPGVSTTETTSSRIPAYSDQAVAKDTRSAEPSVTAPEKPINTKASADPASAQEIAAAVGSSNLLNKRSNKTDPTGRDLPGISSGGQAVPLAAIAPQVAEVAKEKDADLHPGDSYETSSTAGKPVEPSNAATSQGVPAGATGAAALAAVAPIVAEVAYEKETNLHPGESFETTAVAGEVPSRFSKSSVESIPEEKERTVGEDKLPHKSRLSKTVSGDSVKTMSTEDMSMMVEPGTPKDSLADRPSSTFALTEHPKEVNKDGLEGADVTSGKPKPRASKSSKVAFQDNPVYLHSDTDVAYEDSSSTPQPDKAAEAVTNPGLVKDDETSKQVGGTSTAKEISPAPASPTASPPSSPFAALGGGSSIRNMSRSGLGTGSGIPEPEPHHNPAISDLPPAPSSSKKIELTSRPSSKKELEREKQQDEKQEQMRSKAREREEKAKEKLQKKSSKKRESRGFFGFFGGSTKALDSAASGAGAAGAGANTAASAASPAAAASPSVASAVPQAAAAPAQSGAGVGTAIGAGVGAGVGAGALAGVTTAAVASRKKKKAPAVEEPTYLEPVTSPTKPIAPPSTEVIDSTPVVAAAAVPTTQARSTALEAPTEPKSPRDIRSEIQSERTAAKAEPSTAVETAPGTGESVPPVAAIAPSVTDSAPEAPVTPADLAKEKKAKKARAKEIANTDFSAIHMAKTPSVLSQQNSGLNSSAGGNGNQKSLYQPDGFSPMRSGSQQVQSTMLLNKQASLRRQPSGPPAPAQPKTLQTLKSWESKGPKAPLNRGVDKPEVSRARNYRPMSTMAGTAVPPPRRQQSAI